MSSQPSNPPTAADGTIDKLDFDVARKRRQSNQLHPASNSATSNHSLLRDDASFFSDVVDGILESDRRKMKRQLIRYLSFVSAILSCLCAGSITAFSLYGPLFLRQLRYTQYQVNAISTAAELALYLPVPLIGYLTDRYDPRPLSLLGGILFGAGYGLAAGVYQAGPVPGAKYRGVDDDDVPEGWPFWVMILAFVGIGMGTASMYLSAVTTCAKNFGTGRHKGIALAIPIASFGLSGMWQSLVGSYCFKDDTMEGNVDVFRYFCFLGGLLFAVGLVGSVGLNIVDQDELIENAVDGLNRSGLLDEESRNLLEPEAPRPDGGLPAHSRATRFGYGTTTSHADANGSSMHLKPSEDGSRKSKLLNVETRLFLSDSTAYLLAAGFFLTTGPGEAYINNLGTLVHTLYAPGTDPPYYNSPATHVSIVALTSTVARLATGVLADLFAPLIESGGRPQRRLCTVPRPGLLIAATILFSIGQLMLATPLVRHTPSFLPLVTSMVGLGYGAIFSLTPIMISVVWGVQNFGTNWGIVAVVPAGGAAVWGAIYSAVYSRNTAESEGECYGQYCYQGTFAAMAVSSWIALGLWLFAWKKWRRKGVLV